MNIYLFLYKWRICCWYCSEFLSHSASYEKNLDQKSENHLKTQMHSFKQNNKRIRFNIWRVKKHSLEKNKPRKLKVICSIPKTMTKNCFLNSVKMSVHFHNLMLLKKYTLKCLGKVQIYILRYARFCRQNKDTYSECS